MKKYTRTIAALVFFVILVFAFVFIYTSDEYVRARDKLEYLHSDMGKLSVDIEKSINEINGTNNDSAYRDWQDEVAQNERIVDSNQTQCFIFGGLALVSLGCAIVMFIQDRQKVTRDHDEEESNF